LPAPRILLRGLLIPPNVLMVRFSFVGVSPLQTPYEPMAAGGLIPTYDSSYSKQASICVGQVAVLPRVFVRGST